MPHYEFLCHDCQKFFDKILALADYEEGEILCPHTAAAKTSSSVGPFTPSHPKRARAASIEEFAYAFRQIRFRLAPDRRQHLRARRCDRSRRNSQTQEETFQEIPRAVRPHAAVCRGKDTLEMSAPRGRNRRARRASSDGRSQTGGPTAQSRIAGLADCRSHQGSAARRQRHERGAPRGVLGLTIGPGGWM